MQYHLLCVVPSIFPISFIEVRAFLFSSVMCQNEVELGSSAGVVLRLCQTSGQPAAAYVLTIKGWTGLVWCV